MATEQLDVPGLKALDRALEKLPERIERKVLNGALKEAGQPILKDAKARIPKKSGATADDVKLRTVPKGKLKGSVKAAVAVAGSNKKDGRAYIMRFLELGTKKMAAKPWLRPAIDSNSGAAIQIFGKAAWKRIAKEVRKLAIGS